MKSIERLFLDHYYKKNLAVDTGKMYLAVIDEQLFSEAIKEHDAGIVQLIDDMVDSREKWIAHNKYANYDTYSRGNVEIDILTELKNKIKGE